MGVIIVLVLLYLLLVKGFLWKGILVSFGATGLYSYLSTQYPNSNQICITAFGMEISSAGFLTGVVVLLAFMTLSGKSK